MDLAKPSFENPTEITNPFFPNSMPAEPNVGDVFRPENIPRVVFEEVTVTSVGKDAIVTEELHLDGGRSDKTFARGYGEWEAVFGHRQAHDLGLERASGRQAASDGCRSSE